MLLPELPSLSDYPAPDQTLLGWFRPRMDDSMLQEIAAADYGYKEAECLEALRKIRATGKLPLPLPGNVKEVLELIRWSEPGDPEWQPGALGERGHLMRAFCCASLLEAAADPETARYISSENDSIVQLIASVLTLGRISSVAALNLLWNRILTLPEENEERPFFAFGILLLCASKMDLVNDKQLRETAEWVMQEEKRERIKQSDIPINSGSQWLLDLTMFNQMHHKWLRLTQEILLDLPRENEEIAAVLRDIGRRIVDGSAYYEPAL